MSQSNNAPIMQPSGSAGMAGWIQVWMKALTKPSEQTFAEIAASPDATSQNAFTWAAIAGLISGLAVGLLLVVQTALRSGFDFQSSIGLLAGYICGAPIASVILTPIFLAISAGLTQWIAKMFGGTGSFEKLAYTFASILVPFSVISAVLNLFSAIPFVGICINIISSILGFYVLYLNIAATKAVNGFDWGKAAGSVLIPVAVLFLCICVVVGGMMAMGVGVGALSGFGNGQFSP